MQNPNCLIIFLKAPRLGTVKTRLQPEMSPAESLRLYRAMGADLVQKFSVYSGADLYLAYWPEDGLAEIKSWLGHEHRYFLQEGENLGEKMRNAFLKSFRDSYRKTIIIGSDLPTLPATTIDRALQQLDDDDVVLGPSGDGGYYLIGATRDHPALFRDIPWSTPEVLPETKRIAAEVGIRLALLDEQRDVDQYSDVERLWRQISAGTLAVEELPNTAAALRHIFGT